MKKILALLVVPLLAGCLSSQAPSVARWMLDYDGEGASAQKPKYGVGRVTVVTVRAPYNSEGLTVLRSDGSIAFDPYNEYAAPPAQLLRGLVFDAMSASGLFSSVVSGHSIVASKVSAEVQVTRLALDCRADDSSQRTAVADVIVRLVGSSGEQVAFAQTSGKVSASGRNFGQAMSAALSTALRRAFDSFK